MDAARSPCERRRCMTAGTGWYRLKVIPNSLSSVTTVFTLEYILDRYIVLAVKALLK
jgi:hypothetical protein